MKLKINFGREEKEIVKQVEELVFDLPYTKTNKIVEIVLEIDFILSRDYDIFIGKLIELNLIQVINRILGVKR